MSLPSILIAVGCIIIASSVNGGRIRAKREDGPSSDSQNELPSGTTEQPTLIDATDTSEADAGSEASPGDAEEIDDLAGAGADAGSEAYPGDMEEIDDLAGPGAWDGIDDASEDGEFDVMDDAAEPSAWDGIDGASEADDFDD